MLTYKNVCQFACTEHEVPDNNAVQRLLLDLWEICGPSVMGFLKVPVPFVSYVMSWTVK